MKRPTIITTLGLFAAGAVLVAMIAINAAADAIPEITPYPSAQSPTTAPDVVRVYEDILRSPAAAVRIMTVTATPTTIHTPEPTPTLAPLYSEDDVVMMAKIMWAEARGIESDAEVAAVGWTICNRVAAGYGTPAEVMTAPNQFAYLPDAPVWDRLYILAGDVLDRWQREVSGEPDVGRVLPPGYLYFEGDGTHNYFRDEYIGGTVWDWTLPSPYEEG